MSVLVCDLEWLMFAIVSVVFVHSLHLFSFSVVFCPWSLTSIRFSSSLSSFFSSYLPTSHPVISPPLPSLLLLRLLHYHFTFLRSPASSDHFFTWTFPSFCAFYVPIYRFNSFLPLSNPLFPFTFLLSHKHFSLFSFLSSLLPSFVHSSTPPSPLPTLPSPSLHPSLHFLFLLLLLLAFYQALIPFNSCLLSSHPSSPCFRVSLLSSFSFQLLLPR